MRFMILDICGIIDFISGGNINKTLFYIINWEQYMCLKPESVLENEQIKL